MRRNRHYPLFPEGRVLIVRGKLSIKTIKQLTVGSREWIFQIHKCITDKDKEEEESEKSGPKTSSYR